MTTGRAAMVQIGATLERLALISEGQVVGDRRVVISDVHHDPRMVGPGELLVPLRDVGASIAAARDHGAAAVCVREEVPEAAIAQLVVGDVRSALALTA
ncbi:MAG: hypothetical protein OES13_09120, partial [Acidimicrobiia bacterium]|nr:hypothetical protein [Acidimicrobiia bacterium]